MNIRMVSIAFLAIFILLTVRCHDEKACHLPKENCLFGELYNENEIEKRALGLWGWECFEFDIGSKDQEREGELIEFLPGRVLIRSKQFDSMRIETLSWEISKDPLGAMFKTHGGQRRWGNIMVCDEALRFGALTYDGPNHMFKRMGR